MDSRRVGTAHVWIRQNVLGLVAIFIALSGSAVAAQVANQPGAQQAAKKKAKPGPRGPQGPQGPQGTQGVIGPQGPAGSPDTPAQVLAKLVTVDGQGSALDSDRLDGISSGDFQRQGSIGYFTSGATPDVDDFSSVSFQNSSAQAITNLANGDPGQIVAVSTTNAFTTIADGGNFVLAANWTPDARDTLTLVFTGNQWHELARSANP